SRTISQTNADGLPFRLGKRLPIQRFTPAFKPIEGCKKPLTRAQASIGVQPQELLLPGAQRYALKLRTKQKLPRIRSDQHADGDHQSEADDNYQPSPLFCAWLHRLASVCRNSRDSNSPHIATICGCMARQITRPPKGRVG